MIEPGGPSAPVPQGLDVRHAELLPVDVDVDLERNES